MARATGSRCSLPDRSTGVTPLDNRTARTPITEKFLEISMERHEYRGYEFELQVERLASGRFIVNSRITAKSEEEKARSSSIAWPGGRRHPLAGSGHAA